MKNTAIIILTLLFLCSFSCKKSVEPHTECMDAKIEAFKQKPYASSIVKIKHPAGNLYWFVSETADAGEDVLNESCELVCITDCECDGSVVQCDYQLGYPQEVVWRK